MRTQAIDTILDEYSAQRKDRAERQKDIIIKFNTFQKAFNPLLRQ